MNKNIKWLMVSAVAFIGLNSCSDEWDNHYEDTQIVMVNDSTLSEVHLTSEAFLQENAEEFGSMYKFLQESGIFEEMRQKDLLHTLLVVKNDAFSTETVEEGDTAALVQLARSHVSDIMLPPSNLSDGQRVMMWHQKFVSVSLDSTKVSTDVSRISFSGNAVSEVIKTDNGYIYVIDKLIYTPKSLKDLIEGLGDDYSIFKDLVLSSGGREFDKVHSTPIGVDATGNTIYDSVFIYTNEFFDAKNFDLSSESLTATALIFSDDAINKAMATADSALTVWNQTDRDREKLRQWILEVAFFNKEYTAADMETSAASKLTSIYNREWRTNVQQVDLDNVEKVSNGVAYYVKNFRIPNNVLMYRLKDFYYYYENCDDKQKDKYFKATNLSTFSCNTDVAAWTPLVGAWPEVEDRALNAKVVDASLNGYTLDYIPLKRTLNEDGGYVLTPYRIPPGPYRLAMGFKQNLGFELHVSVLLADAEGNIISEPLLEPSVFTVGSATTYHYDRGATLSDAYPEGYKEIMSTLTHNKKHNYDTDGGPVYEEIVIPDLKGDGSPTEIAIRVECKNLSEKTSTMFHHWCLRPTADNY